MSGQPRSWDLWGEVDSRRDGGMEFTTAMDERSIRFRGISEPIPVRVVEDEGGDFIGWIKEGKDRPIMIAHKRIFAIQFPYDYETDKTGRAIRLRIELRTA